MILKPFQPYGQITVFGAIFRELGRHNKDASCQFWSKSKQEVHEKLSKEFLNVGEFFLLGIKKFVRGCVIPDLIKFIFQSFTTARSRFL